MASYSQHEYNNSNKTTHDKTNNKRENKTKNGSPKSYKLHMQQKHI
jgi:hypothetical protein